MNYLMLIDSLNPVPEDEKIKLVKVNGCMLEFQAAECLVRLISEAKRDGVDIEVLSGYRSPEYQKQLWDSAVKEERAKGLSYDMAEEVVSRTLARPYHSEHNSGLAVDFCTPGADDTEDNFYSTKQGRWLSYNAARFGFILRYNKLKRYITGMDFEPWHYRYVGVEAAMIMKNNGLCLEEFLHFYSDQFFYMER